MLVIDVGVKFRIVSVKCANIFDQDCRSGLATPFYLSLNIIIIKVLLWNCSWKEGF
jgi:hypothetical protein